VERVREVFNLVQILFKLMPFLWVDRIGQIIRKKLSQYFYL
jgi:hypothetical protein